ncbi:MAG: hypothetical protein E6I46_12020 [Chloroflexi bacterium]|nr:MAG: hypothetical protein E6I46_12020 [Chloroflexota bacterium]
MTEKQRNLEASEGLSKEELEGQQGEQLPDRDVLSDGSIAYANAEQANQIAQSNLPPPPA